MNISEQISYLKGVAEGLDLKNEDSKEAKLLTLMLDVLDNIGSRLSDLDEEVEVLSDAVDGLADELMDMEDDYYGGEDGTWPYDEDEDEDDDEALYYLVKCPKCGEELEVDEDTLLEGTLSCDSCGQLFELELQLEDEDEDFED